VDADGKMVFFNDIFRKMWDLPDYVVDTRSDEEAVNHVLSQLVDPDAFVARIQALYASPREASESDEIPRKDGRLFARSSRPLFNDDQAIGRVWTFRDITAERRDAQRQKVSEM
jgi:PAS domain-containing protein